MRKILLAFLFMLASAIGSFAQSTTVSGTITDAGSQLWTNGTYSFTFQPNPQFPTNVYTWSGGTLNKVISGSLSGSGTYSASIPSNSSITPAGSKWILTVTPNATSPSFSTPATTITGGTQTLSPTPPAILISWSLPPGPAISAYADGEIGGTLVPGSEYFNTTSLLTRVWNGSAWANQGAGGGGSTCGSSPGQLLYNNAGTCAGTNAITTDGAGNLTVGGNVITGEVLANASVGSNLALTCSPAPCTVQYGTNGQSITNAFTGSLASFTTSTGVTVGSPTGGAEGLGTINATGLFVNGVAVGSGVSITATSPIVVTPSPITGTGVISAPTVVTSAAALTNNAVVIGQGGQAEATISADTTTTHALFATAGAPAFRALTSGDLPAGTGTVTSVSGTTNQINVATGTTTPVVSLSSTLVVPGTFTNSTGGAASSSPMLLNGTLFTGGSTTTTFPYFYINQGAAPTTFSTSGAMIGLNAPSGFGGNFLDFHLNGAAAVLSVASTGQVNSSGGFNTGSGTVNVGNTGSYSLVTRPFIIGTVPTIAAAGCGGSGASITVGNSTAVFNIGVGTAPTAAGCTLTFPAATTGWNVSCNDQTTQSSSVFVQKQTGAISTTSVTIQNFTTAGAAGAPSASDVYHCIALGY